MDASADPVILACSDEDCQRRIDGGGARGMSYVSYGLRLGLLGFVRGDIPIWFQEGVAVVASGYSRDLLPEGTAGSRCRAEPTGTLPAGDAEWRHMGATDNRIYARAACRVLNWMNANGGPQAVGRLVAAVSGGERFADLYRDPSD